MLNLHWSDALTALAALIFVAVVIWWRHKFPKRYDLTLHVDVNQRKSSKVGRKKGQKKPPPDPGSGSDGGYPSGLN